MNIEAKKIVVYLPDGTQKAYTEGEAGVKLIVGTSLDMDCILNCQVSMENGNIIQYFGFKFILYSPE